MEPFSFIERETVKIPGRTNAILYVRVVNGSTDRLYFPPAKKKQCLPRRCRRNQSSRNQSYLRAFNMRDEDLKISILIVKLQEFDILIKSTQNKALE